MSETEVRPPGMDCCMPPPLLPVNLTANGEIFKDVEDVEPGARIFLKGD